MLRIQAISTSLLLHKAMIWLGFAVSGEGVGLFNLECLGGKSYFNGEININQDNRPNFIRDRHLTAKALSKKTSGRYRNRVTVPV
ncbi:hypothetical protein [Chroococcus sp. FPU101]|uniref:hypothetical protein n=1 Tax=Chroococcus sp. FPU101 TaxID=1974212 RepID=UPI001A8FDDCF|nr:hypothetical protein [Chroococcus sp. FPU101]GFE70388.1 hypothetical protein CFPU101_29980 [Chroococcus sp. FPU101]